MSFRSIGRQCLFRCKIGAWFLEAPDGTHRFQAHLKALFSLFGDSANLDPR
jgi:hypothetical protein